MPVRFSAGLLLVSLFLLVSHTAPASAQWSNIETVEGSRGEEMTLTETPHVLNEDVSARALSIARPDTTQWALGLIGTAPEDTISLEYGDESLPIERIERPSDGIGPTRVFVSAETFLTIAETEAVTLRIGDATLDFPEDFRREMKRIFERGN